MSLTRRSLIGASGAGLALGVIGLAVEPAAASASSSPGSFAVVDRKTMPLTSYSPDWSSQHTISTPVYLELSHTSGVSGGFVATIAFDTRLFEAAETVDLFQGSSVRTLVLTAGPTLADGRGQVSFGMDRGLGNDEESTVSFAVPLNRRETYPAENFGASAPFSLTVTSPTGGETLVRQWVSIPGRSGLAPWAATLTAGWSDTIAAQAGKDVKYRYPSAIHVLSVGPHAVPPGVLTVAVDPRAVASLEVTEATLDGLPLAVSTTAATDRYSRQLTVAIPVEVPAGSTVIVRVAGVAVPGRPSLATARHATARFTSSADPARPRRAGGAVDLVDLTTSGNPLTPDSAK